MSTHAKMAGSSYIQLTLTPPVTAILHNCNNHLNYEVSFLSFLSFCFNIFESFMYEYNYHELHYLLLSTLMWIDITGECVKTHRIGWCKWELGTFKTICRSLFNLYTKFYPTLPGTSFWQVCWQQQVFFGWLLFFSSFFVPCHCCSWILLCCWRKRGDKKNEERANIDI